MIFISILCGNYMRKDSACMSALAPIFPSRKVLQSC
jgi:hypothetical protein